MQQVFIVFIVFIIFLIFITGNAINVVLARLAYASKLSFRQKFPSYIYTIYVSSK